MEFKARSQRPTRIPGVVAFSILLVLAGGEGFGATYVVRKGDTLTEIAEKHDLTLSALTRANDISSSDILRPGQKLTLPEARDPVALPKPARVVVVKKNETLTLIARVNGVEVQDLANANGISLKDPIYPGQQLRIPSGPVATPVPDLDPAVQRAIDREPVRKGRWKYIVVHHSATPVGSVKGMDEYHRKTRHMENGLAYHFVIGNGRGMKDGEVAVGSRWTRQLQGGHLSSEKLNEVSIGICLVGDFNKSPPTRDQLDALEALLEALLKRCSLKPDSIKTHKQIQPNHTECPGRRFNLNEVKRRLN
jgi:LysM repeat protein